MTTQERIAKYLEAIPPAIAGTDGHGQTFKVACSLYNGWNLSQEDTLAWLRIYNQRCQPPWTAKELAHKAADAAKAGHNKPRGYLLAAAIADQRGDPDRTLPSVAIVSGKISTTLTTIKTNLRAYACNAYRNLPVIPPARKPENNVVNVVKQGISPLEGLKMGDLDEPLPGEWPIDESKAAWIAVQLKMFFTEGLIPVCGDGTPNMDMACELAGWLKLSVEAYEARGVKTDDEEIRRTALACQFEYRGGRLPTKRAALGFLSVRLLAMRPVEDYVEGGDVASPVPEGGTEPVFLPFEATDSGANCGTAMTLDPCAIALDLETYSVAALGAGKAAANDEALTPHKGDVRLLAYCDGESPEPTVVDLLPGGAATQLPEGLVERLCGAELVIHNALFDLRFLRTHFSASPKAVWCTLTASRLLDPGKSIHGLGQALERHLGVRMDKALARSDWAALMLTEGQLKYAADDVRYLLALRSRLAELLAAARLAHVFELEMRLILVVARMEAQGFSVDVERLRELRMSAAQVADPIAAQLRNGLGRPHLNLESPSQLVAAFNVAGIAIAGTDDDTLAARPEPLVQLLRAYRKPASLAGYAGMLLAAQREGRIHAAYSSTGTVNGRFTCENPNLQNVPRNREMRSCFVPSTPDRRLIVADYGQIELRIAALIAEESVMIKAFRSGEDLHRAISAACLRKSAGDVTPEERKLGKAVNFGFLYGQGAEGFQVYARSQYGVEISLGEARRFRDEFFRAYPAIRRWHDNCWRRAKDGVDVERTVFGRIVQARPSKGAPEVTDWNRFNMLTEYRVCGSAADLLKVAMVRIDAAMPEDAHIVATVHDELILDVPVETAAFCLEMTKHEMELAFVEMFGTEVPVEVESKVCANWGEKE